MRTDPRPLGIALPASLLGLVALAACSEPSMQARITDSIGTLSRVQASDSPVDPEVFRQARGIAIVDETQAGLVVSGAGGEGLLLRRSGTGWSAPCAIKVQGFGVGLTLGGEGRSLVIVFGSDATLDQFVADGNYFLAQAQGTFGDSYGRTADPVQKREQVHVYAVAGGVYATAALGSIGFKIDHDANVAAYGTDVTEWDILDGKVSAPVGQSALVSRIDRIATPAEVGPRTRIDRTEPEATAASRAPASTSAHGD
jgi:lipid-binding SYLF domain-containing protein